MFTQCPSCQTTFRVSAEVLQQADGRVRCGGCSNAFNALEHLLGEDGSPATPADQSSTESATDQSKQLLKTLEKLAGPEVTLDDTDVEWRALEDAESGDGSDAGEAADPDETGSLRFVIEGGDDGEGSEKPAMLGRQDDIPKPVSDAQESLDFPSTEPPQINPSERRYDDDTILPDDFGQEDDLDEIPFLEKPETPKRRAGDRGAIRDTAEFDDAQDNLALGEPDDWLGLLDEVGDEEMPPASEGEVASDAPAEEPAATADDTEPAADEPPEEDMPSDIDTQFLLQAEEMGLDTGRHRVIEDSDAEDDDEQEDDEEFSIEDALALEDDEEEEELDEDERESTGEFEAQIAVAKKALQTEEVDEDVASDEEPDKPVELELEKERADSDSDDETNEDEGALASAIKEGEDVSKFFDEDSQLVETIIMEGDVVGHAAAAPRDKAAQPSSTFKNPGPLEDTYSLSRERARSGKRASDPPGYTVMAGIVVLILALVGQILHQSRQTLATYGAFNHTIGPIYRVLGKPVTPEWSVRGWQFEATSNSVDEEQDLLTIYSRIANKSGNPLPYPLVHISLTDRWEDIIGSRVLEPNDYLAGDLDPRKPVPSGENFTAVITIESPSAEATGFKLTVCYRVAQGRMRCATQDFKN